MTSKANRFPCAHPVELPGVRLDDLLEAAVRGRGQEPGDLRARVAAEAERLGVAPQFLERGLNVEFSGGEQKRLVLEALLRGPDEVLLLDEPDNYLDVPGKRWLEEELRQTRKSVLLVSHDRELLARAADRIITV